MSDLLPCPFCCGADIVAARRSELSLDFNPPLVMSSPECRRCGARLARQYEDAETAIAAWNRRASSWVNVEERLPAEDADPVLVYGPDIGVRANYFRLPTGWWAGDAPQVDLAAVTHWMPLPEPPTKETP